MPTPTRRSVTALVALALTAVLLGAAAPASADPIIPVRSEVDASTTIRKLGQTVTFPYGVFDGGVDLADSSLEGTMWLAPTTATLRLAGIPLATASLEVQQAGLVTGSVDLATMQATAHSTVVIRLTALRPTFWPSLNLVSPTCRAENVQLTMSGPIGVDGSGSLSGTYTIPNFVDCGWLTGAINLLIPGTGNTFSATLTPIAA
jgi:hypothetical protein